MFGIWSRRKVHLIDYWYVYLEDFETSTSEFYAAIRDALIRRKVPGLEVSIIEFPEGGAFSAQRQYLRMRRERLIFDVCSAPFGTSWFFSCRFGEIPMKLRVWEAAAALGLVYVAFRLHWTIFGLEWGASVFALNFLGSLYLLNSLVAMGLYDLDSVLLKIPVIGAIYETFLRRDSYYRHDTRRMYCTTIDRVVQSVIEEVAGTKGVEHVNFEHETIPTGLGFWGRLREALSVLWSGTRRG